MVKIKNTKIRKGTKEKIIEVKPIHKTRHIIKTKCKYYGICYDFQIRKKKIIDMTIIMKIKLQNTF